MALTLPAGSRGSNTAGVAAAGSKIGLDFAAEESVHTADDVTSRVHRLRLAFWLGCRRWKRRHPAGAARSRQSCPKRHPQPPSLAMFSWLSSTLRRSASTDLSYPFRKA